MGKYTSLARKTEEDQPQVGEVLPTRNILNVNINNIHSDGDSGVSKQASDRPKDTLQGFPSVEMLQDSPSSSKGGADDAGKFPTPLRGYAVNAVVRCIHRMASEECAVCSGYVRWLLEEDHRLRAAQANPEAMRRRYWAEMNAAEVF